MGMHACEKNSLTCIAKLTSLFVRLLSFSSFSKVGECMAFATVGKSIVRVKANGLLKGDKGLLVAIESGEYIAFAVVGSGKVGVKANGLLIGDQRFVVALEVGERDAFAVVGRGKVGVKANGLLKGDKGLFILLKLIKRFPLFQPLLCSLL